MRMYKIIEEGYIVRIGMGFDGTEIKQAEYDEILSAIRSKPVATYGHDYRLREDLTWEEYDLPPADPVEDDEISDAEALAIILGGAEA